MFIGRERELGVLDKLYRSEKFEFAVIYGRRRVGKTALINEFIKDKKAVYFTGVENSAVQNLDNLSRSILEVLAGNESTAVFPTRPSSASRAQKKNGMWWKARTSRLSTVSCGIGCRSWLEKGQSPLMWERSDCSQERLAVWAAVM